MINHEHERPNCYWFLQYNNNSFYSYIYITKLLISLRMKTLCISQKLLVSKTSKQTLSFSQSNCNVMVKNNFQKDEKNLIE